MSYLLDVTLLTSARPSEIVADKRSGFLVQPADLEGFVEKVLMLSNNTQLRSDMSLECRRMAEEATWDSIGNRVAWKMAKTLESTKSNTVEPPSVRIPLYSWLLLSEGLRNLLVSFVGDARLIGSLGIIFGVWFGLIVTWIMVKLSLGLKARGS
jgi:hypothetical protein